MRFKPDFLGYTPDLPGIAPFAASVPGNIQSDFIEAHPEFAGDINFGLEHKKLEALEPYTWYYTATLDYALGAGEKLWFVTEGIDYEWSLALDGEEFFSHEGMFSRVELCLTDILKDKLRPGAEFSVVIRPHPVRRGVPHGRDEASDSVKPPVSYGWDWHPRVIPSGIWDETYFETRADAHIADAFAKYVLSDDLSSADVAITVDAAQPARVTFRSPRGEAVAEGKTTPESPVFRFTVRDPELWYCRGMGEPSLYTYEVETDGDRRTGTVGFRRVRLVMNDGAWSEPKGFPKSRSFPPAQIELNGERVFAKGSNYVNQDIFTGKMTRERYEETIRAAAECNMNIFRCWGGSGVQKEDFYDLCDRYGIMLWVEFPLACCNYSEDAHYLCILEQEARAIITKIGRHPSLVLWCGGNELFCSWSGMTDQHPALRLLNKLTYEMTPEIPFNMTSPLSGMKHGGYTFIDRDTGLDPFALFGNTRATAYTEFGVPAITSAEYIKDIIPEDELFPPERGGSWEAHHAFGAWGDDAWLCFETLSRFGDTSTLEATAKTSAWLQSVGYKAIFEAARRQKPYCSMAINWCWCEPWKCAVNNSLIAWKDIKKDAYFAVKDSLCDVLGAAEIPKFTWSPGETMTLIPWLLNDTKNVVHGTVTLSVTFRGELTDLGSSYLETDPLCNAKGSPLTFTVPSDAGIKERITVIATLDTGTEKIANSYELVVE